MKINTKNIARKIFFLFSFFYFLNTHAQAPDKMSYQAVIRNATNTLVANQGVGMKISILQGTATGTEVYKELFNPNPTTNANGLVTIAIGTGLPITGTFEGINWSAGPYFIKTETDPTGGTNYTITATTQLMSVPYALSAKTTTAVNGTINYISKFTSNKTIGNSVIKEDSNGNIGINTDPNIKYRLSLDNEQLTANGDGQHNIYGFRNRDTQNDGSGYGRQTSNTAVTGHNIWGDLYTFGVGGWNDNDNTRTGGVLGSESYGAYWGSLGYRSSASVNYGVYGTSTYANGAGRSSSLMLQGIGGGFFGEIGSVSKGNVVGQINSGNQFAAYNSGNVYTFGKNIELVGEKDELKTAVYTITAEQPMLYSKGSAKLINGETYISFSENFKKLLAETPEITVTPKGNCNGLYIASSDKNGFTVKELNNGNSNIELSWIVAGNRIDFNQNKAENAITQKDFEQNIQETLFNDGNTTDKGKSIWVENNTLKFGEMPESLHKVEKPKEENTNKK